MTVAADVARRVEYSDLTGATNGPFTVTFPFYEIDVYLDGDLVDSDEYTIVQASPGSTGHVSFATNPEGDLVIVGATVQSQETDFIAQDSVLPEEAERALDRLTMITQELETILGSSIRISDGLPQPDPFGPDESGYVRVDAGVVSLTDTSVGTIAGTVTLESVDADIADVEVATFIAPGDSDDPGVAQVYVDAADDALDARLVDVEAVVDSIVAGAVSSVAGRTGAVVLVANDISNASANGKSLITAANYAAMKALLDLEIGTDVQAYSAVLAATDASFTSAKDAKLANLVALDIDDATATGISLMTAANAAAATAVLSAFVGDSGSGGIKGMVPAPASGDANKYLKGDGTYDTPTGGSGGTQSDPQGRLTLSTGVPVMTSDVSGAATLYYTPYCGNTAWFYNGSQWVSDTFSELSIALSGGTASKPHDVFLDYNAGTPQLVLVAWTNDTTRATGLATQDGRYVKTGDLDHLYLGTVYLDGSKQCTFSLGGTAAGGTAATIGVWNMYHRRQITPASKNSTGSWTYNSTTWRNAANSATTRITLVRGIDDEAVLATYLVSMVGGASGDAISAIGLDGTTPSPGAVYCSSGNNNVSMTAKYEGYPGIGLHYLQALERQATTASTATFFGVVSTTQIADFSASLRY